MVAFKVLLAFMLIGMVQAQIRGCYWQDQAKYRTSGYGQFNSNKGYRWGLCSHAFYAFASISGNTITAPSDGMKIVTSFKDYNPSLKVILSIGGANSWAFPGLVNSGNIGTWAKNAVAFAKANKFDGIDIDWEQPTNAAERNGLTNIMKSLRSAAGSGFLVTIAVRQNPSVAATAYDLNAIKDSVDFVNAMSYDYSGSGWSAPNPLAPLSVSGKNNAGNVQQTIEYYLKYIPANKLVMGIPVYAVGWTLSSANGNQGFGASYTGPSKAGPILKEAGFMAQYETCKLKGTLTYDSATQTRYRQDGNQWFSYEIVQSVTAKMNYLKSKKLAGAFVWSLDQDDIYNSCGNSYPYVIMNTINKELIGKTI